MALCKCGCGERVAQGRVFVDKQHQNNWLRAEAKSKKEPTFNAPTPVVEPYIPAAAIQVEPSLAYTQPQTSFVHQLGALVVSLLAFFLIWFLAGLILAFIAKPDPIFNFLNSAFRDVFAPWLGGNIGLTVAFGMFQKSTAKFVFNSFTVVLILLIGAYLGMVGMVHTEAGVSIGSLIWGALTLVAGIFGAFKAASDNGYRL